MQHSKFRLGFLFFCLLAQNVFAGYADFAASFALQPEKRQAWQEMTERVNQTVDGIGYPIDEKIKETVIVLNLLGFRTIASCEGHLDHGHCYPWIQLGIEQAIPEHLMQKLKSVDEQIQQIKFPVSNEDAEYIKIFELRRILADQIEQHVLQQTLPMHQLLEQFYSTSNAQFHWVQIGEERFQGGEVRIYSRDGDWQLIRQENEKKANLLQYRQEMDRFTDFLIDKFLNQSTSPLLRKT